MQIQFKELLGIFKQLSRLRLDKANAVLNISLQKWINKNNSQDHAATSLA